MDSRTLRFSMDRFVEEVEMTLSRFDEPDYFDISDTCSAVYRRFLELDLADRPAIRGQLEGPISFGFNTLDQDERPILFDDTVRPFMLEFMARRLNVQLGRLKQINPNAFMFVDEPGLQFLFSALSGYGDIQAKADLDRFFSLVERPRGIHLCGNPDWDFLLNLDLDVLSLDIYTNAEIFASYAGSIRRLMDRGGNIVWGLVPTGSEPFSQESLSSLIGRLEAVWKMLWTKGVDKERMLAGSMLSPAICCLVNPDKEATVERAFTCVNRIARKLKSQYHLL